MSLIEDTVTRLRAQLTTFGAAGSVRAYALADLPSLQEDETLGGLTLPAAFVVLVSEALDEEAGAMFQQLLITETLGVVVVLDNSADSRGDASVIGLEALRDDLIAALKAWKPDTAHEEMRWVGSAFADLDRAHYFHQYNFEVVRH